MKEPKIIMPEKKELSDYEKEKTLDRAFHPYGDESDRPLEQASNEVITPFEGRDAELLKTGQPELEEAHIIRGKQLGEKRGMISRLPLEERAEATLGDESLDDVAPMRRAAVLAEREARKKLG